LQRIEAKRDKLIADVDILLHPQNAKARTIVEAEQKSLIDVHNGPTAGVRSVGMSHGTTTREHQLTLAEGQDSVTIGTTTAAVRVFEVTEILESIMLEVPMRDLLLSKRVSRQFQQTIVDTVNLHSALFFEPAPATVEGQAV